MYETVKDPRGGGTGPAPACKPACGGSLVQIGSLSVESTGRDGMEEMDWTVSYTDMGGRKEQRQVSKDFSTLSKADWQSFMRWIESVRERIRESAR